MRGIEDPVLKAPPLAVSGKETEPKFSIWPLLEWKSKWEILETSPRGDRDKLLQQKVRMKATSPLSSALNSCLFYMLHEAIIKLQNLWATSWTIDRKA